MHKVFVKLIALAISVAVAAPAQAQCWSTASADAAKVRDLETMMMVSALRCRLTGQDFLAKYNRFVRENRSALTVANTALRAHFAATGSGLNGYDKYVTSMANRYGAGADGLSCRDMASIVDAGLDSGGHYAKLLHLAERADTRPYLAGGLCNAAQVARAR